MFSRLKFNCFDIHGYVHLLYHTQHIAYIQKDVYIFTWEAVMGGISTNFRWCHAMLDFVYGSINKAFMVMQTFILSLFIVVNVLWFSYYLSMGSCSTNKDIIFWLSSFTCQHWNWEKSANRKESLKWQKINKISLRFECN